MNLHETMLKEQIESLARRIKEIEESSDPTVLKSNKLLEELQKEKLEIQLDGWQRNIPTIEAESYLVRISRAMGFERYDFPELVDDEAAQYGGFKTIIEKMGFPEKCCERAIAQLAICEIGELPKPNMIANSGQGCDADKFQRRSLANLLNIPVFYVDVPLNEEDKPNLTNLNYIATQLEEFIEWAEEKIPGVKYNRDKHIEALEMDAVGEKYRQEIYQLMKHVPCPITPLDKHRKRIINFEPSRYPNMKKAVEYLRSCRDELGERVASGKGPYPEERLRLLWSGQVPEPEVLDLGKLLMERKVAMPLNVGGPLSRMPGLRCRPIGEVSEYGIVLSPIQEEARRLDYLAWGGPGKRWVNLTLDIAGDIGAHGIIHYLLIGCTPMRSMGSVVADRAEKELGIPTLNIEGRVHDRDYRTQEQFEDILAPFIDKCFDWAGKPRQ